jgi:hypothetical protein
MKQIKKVAKNVERRMIEAGSMDDLIRTLIFDIQRLKQKVDILEEFAHPKRDFVVCDKCKQEIKEK